MKKNYRYEIHFHTKEFGWCGMVPAAEAVRIHKNIGYDGICVTDHYSREALDKFPGESHSEKLERWLLGYYNAKKAAIEYPGFEIFLGAEIRLDNGPEEFLIYGPDKEFFLLNPDIFSLSVKELHILIQKNGYIMIQAHPFRNGAFPVSINDIDGIEVYNGNIRHKNNNRMAEKTAAENNLIETAGSDFHQHGDEGGAAMVFPEKIESEKDLVHNLIQRRGRIIRNALK